MGRQTLLFASTWDKESSQRGLKNARLQTKQPLQKNTPIIANKSLFKIIWELKNTRTLLETVLGEFGSIFDLFEELDSTFSGLVPVISELPLWVSWTNMSSGYLR